MICPTCDAFYSRAPEECSTCHTKVRLCGPCFGTGKIKVISTEDPDFAATLQYITCIECEGRGLIKVIPPAEPAEATPVEPAGQNSAE